MNLEFSIQVMIKETFPLKYVGLNWYIIYKTNKSKSPQKVGSHVQDFKVSHFRWYDPQYLMPSWCGRILSIEKPKAHIIKYPSDRCHLRTYSTHEKNWPYGTWEMGQPNFTPKHYRISKQCSQYEYFPWRGLRDFVLQHFKLPSTFSLPILIIVI